MQKIFVDDKASEFQLFSGLSNNLRVEQLAKRIISLKEAIDTNSIGTQREKGHEKEVDVT